MIDAMRVRSSASRLLAASATAIVLAACGSSQDQSKPQTEVPTGPTATAVAAKCPRSAEGLGIGADHPGGLLPADLVPSYVIWCKVRPGASPGPAKKARYFIDEVKTTDAPAALLSTLKLPDLVDPDATCSIVMNDPTYLLVVDNDRAAHVRLPQDPCDNPRQEVLKALRQTNFKQVASYSILVDGGGRAS